MNNKTLYQKLEQQYQQLKQRLDRAVRTGRFASFSAFRQQQWLQSLRRCRLQLSRVGAGVALVTALGVGQSAQAQMPVYQFVERTGTANPFDGISETYTQLQFVDLDGDLDLDMVVNSDDYYSSFSQKYYINNGNVANADFTLATGALNPLSGISTQLNNASSHCFVDIDGDGDLDLFAANKGETFASYTYANNAKFYYAKNEGTNRNPNFVDHTDSADHPLSDVTTYLQSLWSNSDVAPRATFADVDQDGDQDCIVTVFSEGGWGSVSRDNMILYYKNVGTVTAPQFQRQSPANNPFQGFTNLLSGTVTYRRSLQFHDFDRDGDMDVAAIPRIRDSRVFYAENVGSQGVANYTIYQDSFVQDVVDSVSTGNFSYPYRIVGFAELTNDSRVDVMGTDGPMFSNTSINIRFFETTNIILSVPHLAGLKLEALQVFPNPTQGSIRWEQPLTGQVEVYNSLGQQVYSKSIDQAQALELDELSAGTYLMVVVTEEQVYQQTVVLK